MTTIFTKEIERLEEDIMKIQKVDTMFEELFLNEEEEKIYQLQKLEKRFILSEEDILWKLDKERLKALDDFNRANKSFLSYKLYILNSKGFPTSKAIRYMNKEQVKKQYIESKKELGMEEGK